MKLTRPEPGQPILVSIPDIDGEKVYQLRYPLGVAKELEAKHGILILRQPTPAEREAGKLHFGEALQQIDKLPMLLYYGLKTVQPHVTEEWVEAHVDMSMVLYSITPYMMNAATGLWPNKDAIRRIEGEDAESDAPNPTTPQQQPDPISTGSRSGPSDGTISALASTNSGR